MREGPKPYIPGKDVVDILLELKCRYGIRQTTIADILGVSRQAITDLKAGKRRFTGEMFEKFLVAFSQEPWGSWVAEALVEAFLRHYRYLPEDQLHKRLDAFSCHSKEVLEIANKRPAYPNKAPSSYPVFSIPVTGDPDGIPGRVVERLALPPALAAQAANALYPYVLRIDFDDVSGRLRRGDLVLVLQDTDRETEVMLVQLRGEVRLARRAMCCRETADSVRDGIQGDGWIAMDSAKMIEPERVVGCVVGIVQALL